MSHYSKLKGGTPDDELCRHYIKLKSAHTQRMQEIINPDLKYSEVQDLKYRIGRIKKFTVWFENSFPARAKAINNGTWKPGRMDT